MKKVIKLVCYGMAVCAAFLMSNCSKKPGDEKMPLVDTAIVNAMYPASQSYTQSGNVYLNKYEYDTDNHLVKIARDSTVITEIGTNTVNVTTNLYTSSDRKLYQANLTSYVYTLVGTPGASVNFFNTGPTQVEYTYYTKDVKSGVTQSRPGGLVQFVNNKDNLPVKLISSDGGGYNHNFTYDGNGNLNKVEFVSLSGPRASSIYSRFSMTAFDDKPSPFSSLKGYWPASFPQPDAWDYALAYCKNNPTQITRENYDVVKSQFVVNEQDDFTYVYNDKGYPTQIKINMTYFGATTTSDTRTYSYTYK